MRERLLRMIVKELIQVFRNPRMRVMVFLPPLIQLIVFGYAATTDVWHAATALYDLDNTVISRDIAARFQRSGHFDIVEHIGDEARARDIFDRGGALVVIRMNKGFAENLLAGRSAQLQLAFDGTDSNSARILAGYAAKIAQKFSEETLYSRYAQQTGPGLRPGRVALESRVWFNENLESRSFFIPGVIALLLMVVTISLSSMAVVRETEIGTMEQILVTPIKPIEFLLGKTIPYAAIGFFDLMLVLIIGTQWFDVPVRGSIALLFFGTGLYLLSTLGVGLWISATSRTQQQAMMSTFFFFQPAVLLSGFIFPIANMPEAVQWITYLNPLRYFLIIIRGIFLKGLGLDILWPQFLALAGIGAVLFTLSSRRLKKYTA